MAKVEIRGVSKSYALNRSDSVIALKGIDLTIEDGEFVALLGPSGCGKSTLLHLVAALEEVTTGSILVDGEAPALLRDQHRLGIAFQDSALLPWLSVNANVALPFKIAGRPVAAITRREHARSAMSMSKSSTSPTMMMWTPPSWR